jgi:hypothetical protein
MIRTLPPVVLLALALGVAGATPALATPITITIGDNDGFGLGIADNAALPGLDPFDTRSAGEVAATDGQQQTDIFSALTTPVATSFELVFAFDGVLTDGVLEIDLADFQGLGCGGVMAMSFNGIAQFGLLNINLPSQGTSVRQFALGAAAIQTANATGQFVVGIDRGVSCDAVAFDYFKFSGNLATTEIPEVVPEPSTFMLLGLGLAGLACVRVSRRSRIRPSRRAARTAGSPS